jgi:hypothetical protein
MSTPLQAVDNPDAAAVDVSRTMGVDIDDVAQTLAAAGYRAESLAVMAASDVAKQLSPLQFLCLVFVGSFFFGRRLRR